MNREKRKQAKQKRRHFRVRNRVHGTAERPRLSVFRSSKNIYAQIINDDEGRTLLSTSTRTKDVRDGELGELGAHGRGGRGRLARPTRRRRRLQEGRVRPGIPQISRPHQGPFGGRPQGGTSVLAVS